MTHLVTTELIFIGVVVGLLFGFPFSYSYFHGKYQTRKQQQELNRIMQELHKPKSLRAPAYPRRVGTDGGQTTSFL